jgi:hypothetical protein
MNEDIEKFVSETVQHNPRFWRIPDDRKVLIRDSLTSALLECMYQGSHSYFGTLLTGDRFRWIALQLDNVSKCRSIMMSLHHTLSSLPKNVRRGLQSHIRQQHLRGRPTHYPSHIFEWLCFSRRPIWADELGTIYLLGKLFHFPFNPEHDLFWPDGILNTCRGLLILKDTLGRGFGSRCHDDLNLIYV